MYNRRVTPQMPTTELFMDRVLERTDCKKHKVTTGIPCFHIGRSSGGYFPGICNKRAKRAGFDAPIRPESLRLKRTTK